MLAASLFMKTWLSSKEIDLSGRKGPATGLKINVVDLIDQTNSIRCLRPAVQGSEEHLTQCERSGFYDIFADHFFKLLHFCASIKCFADRLLLDSSPTKYTILRNLRTLTTFLCLYDFGTAKGILSFDNEDCLQIIKKWIQHAH